MSRMTIEQATIALESAGWKTYNEFVSQWQEAPERTFISDYAAISLCLVDDVDQLLRIASDAEIRLLELGSTPAANGKDLYLVFVAPAIPARSTDKLQSLLDNTYGCRKIILEQIDGHPQDVLARLPMLGIKTATGSGGEVRENAADMPQLLRKALKDLATRSPAQILERLLAGVYKEGLDR